MRHFTLTLALFIAFCAPANAERWTLSTHGFWTVEFGVISGVSFCEAKNAWTEAEGYFHGAALGVNEDGHYVWNVASTYWEPITTTPVTDYTVVFRGVGPEAVWTFKDAEVSYAGGGMWLATMHIGPDPYQREFVADLMRHTDLDVLDTDGSVMFNFSLRGSSAAVRALDECRQRIMP